MGAEKAVVATEASIVLGTGMDWVPLMNYLDEVVVKIELSQGDWIVWGRVVLFNKDGDDQPFTAQLCGDVGVSDVGVIDDVGYRIEGEGAETLSLQGGVSLRRTETVTLQCNTYRGSALQGSIVAVKVDAIEYQ